MVELVAADGPDVVCLQELPLWGMLHLERWSGMQPFAVAARRAPVPGRFGASLTWLNQGLFRSALVGQANAILVARTHPAEDAGHTRISDHGRERRVVQAVRVAERFLVANLHASNDAEVARAEIERAREFVDELARPDDVVVLAGDFNVTDLHIDGYSEPAIGLDHVFVSGARASAPLVWPRERRTRKQVVLSDHPPVEVVIDY
jgi:endonuclease/exonuclease/phosphatase family metal-dependent hydrolase